MTEETAIVEVIEAEYVPLGTIRTAGPVAMIQQATDIAAHLADIVESRKLYSLISGKKHVRVEGWTTLGAMLGVLPREVRVEYRPADPNEGQAEGYEAYVELVRVNDGAVIGGASAICTRAERNWQNRDEFAIRSMATTRATGKAYRLGFSWIMTLAGYEPTPAEEMTGDPEPRKRGPSPRRQPQRQPQDNGDKWKEDWQAFAHRAMREIPGPDSTAYYKHQKHVLSTLRQELGDENLVFWKDGTALAVPEGQTAESLYALLEKHTKDKEAPATE